jgi:transcriptional regulator with XRE-family HTH domain
MLMNLKAALAVRRLRQAELALELKISTGLLSEVIQGRKDLPPHLRTRAAEFLRADEAWLFSATTFVPPLRQRTREEVAEVVATA